MKNQAPHILPQKRKNQWLVWLIASPFLLFALLCVLLYLPPVQNFVVDKVADVASEATACSIFAPSKTFKTYYYEESKEFGTNPVRTRNEKH